MFAVACISILILTKKEIHISVCVCVYIYIYMTSHTIYIMYNITKGYLYVYKMSQKIICIDRVAMLLIFLFPVVLSTVS